MNFKMSANVKFYLEPTFVQTHHSGDIIIQIANELEGEKSEEACAPRTSRRRLLRRYYTSQRNLLERCNNDREVVSGTKSSNISADSNKTQKILKTIFLFATLIYGISNSASFCFCPTSPSLLIPAFFFLFDASRKTMDFEKFYRCSSNMCALIFGSLISFITSLSIIWAIYSPLKEYQNENLTVASMFILISLVLINIMLLSIFQNLGADGRLMKHCFLQVVIQFVCCVGFLLSQKVENLPWIDPVFSAILSVMVSLAWIFFRELEVEKKLNMKELISRITSLVLDHERNIESVREIVVEQYNQNEVITEICILFCPSVTPEESLCSIGDLRNKLLRLDFIHKAFVRCF